MNLYDALKKGATEQDIRNHFGLLQVMVKELEARVKTLEAQQKASERRIQELNEQIVLLQAAQPVA